MTQAVVQVRNIVARSGFANPLTLEVLVTDEDYLKVYADTTLLDNGPDYTITGIGDVNGVEIEIIGAEDVDNYVGYLTFTALFEPPLDQQADLSSGGVLGRAFENGLDQQNRRMQSLASRVDRSIKLPPNIDGDIVLGQPVDGAVPVWDADTGTITWRTISEQTVLNPSASAIEVTPAGTITALNVQDALEELDDLKLARAGGLMTGPIGFTHQASPANPAAGVLALFAKTDNKFYSRTSDGTETEIGAGGTTITDIVFASDTCAFDGATDDYADLQAAATSAAGKTLVLPAGTAMLSQDVSWPAGIRVLGIPGLTWLKATNGNVSSPVLTEIVNDNVLFDGVGFDGNITNIAGFNNVVTVFEAERVRFINCRWANCKGISAIFSKCTESGIESSFVNDCGIYQLTSGTPADRKQAFAFTGAFGGDNYVRFCHFENVGLDCISTTDAQATGFEAIGNVIRTNYAGAIYFSTSSGFRVIGNDIRNGSGGGNGIDINASSDGMVANNVCVGNGASGILIADSSRVVVVGNICKNNWQSGTSTHRGGITLAVTDGTEKAGIVLSGNQCFDDQGAGSVTQRYAIGVVRTSGTWAEVVVANDNRLVGYNSSGLESVADVFQTGDLGLSGKQLSKRGRGKVSSNGAVASSVTITSVGLAGPSSDGTGTSQGQASTNGFTRQQRLNMVSAASTGANTGIRFLDWKHLADAGRVTMRFGWEAFQTNAALFVGVKANAVHGNADPSSFVNCFGVGIDSGQTTLRLLHNDASGSCTATDLGANFPANTSATDWYELEMWWGDAATVVYWKLTRLSAGNVAKGCITANLPGLTTIMNSHIIGNTRTGSSALGLSWGQLDAEAY